MTISRRKPHTPAAPRLDSAPDADELYPCTVDRLNREATARLNGTPIEPTPYDVLHDYISGPKYERAKTEARTLCGTCPIWEKCLPENRYTAWGRAVIGSRRMGRPATSPCGSLAAYTRHLKNKQTPCDACKGAYADYRREYREKKRGQGEVAA